METKIIIGIIVVIVIIAAMYYYTNVYKPDQQIQKATKRVIAESKKRTALSELNMVIYFENGAMQLLPYHGKIREKIIDVIIAPDAQPSESADSVWDVSGLINIPADSQINRIILGGQELNALADIEPVSSDGEYEVRNATITRIDDGAVLKKLTISFD